MTLLCHNILCRRTSIYVYMYVLYTDVKMNYRVHSIRIPMCRTLQKLLRMYG